MVQDSSKQKLNILISYVYMTDKLIGLLKKNESDIRLLIDSGAFTVWKAGKRIKLKDYINFIKTLPIKPWRYFTLDVIGDGKKTYDNYLRMLDEGLKPVPIFTRGEDFKMLDKYYETSDLVAIGGLVGTPYNKGYVKRVMREVDDRKVHWLGFSWNKFMYYYKPYSCDVSNTSRGTRYGFCEFYIGNLQWVRFLKRNFIKHPYKDKKKLFDIYNESYEEMYFDKNWKGTKESNGSLYRIPIKSWVLCSLDVEKILKTKLFLVATEGEMAKDIMKYYYYWRNNENNINLLRRS